MAATDRNFDAQGFIDGIHFAMSLGMPPNVVDQLTFHFRPTVTNVTPSDDESVPFDPNARPVVVTLPTKKVPCAVQYQDSEGKVENFGIIVPASIILTFLDEDYQQVKGFDWVALGPNRYFYRKTLPPLGMDSVGVWQVYCRAEDEG